jgi:polo-like kinase 1
VSTLSQRERLLSPATASASNGLSSKRNLHPPQLPNPLPQAQQLPELKGPSVWIKKWVDYSSKYGLGYLLSNNSTGVFFNDSTKIVLENSLSQRFYYYERKAVSATEKQDVMTTHSLVDFPKELQKKVTLLQHFRSYLETNSAISGGAGGAAGPTSGRSANVVDGGDVEMKEENGAGKTVVYVKKWMRTKHAIMFRLSNKIV